MITLTIVYNNIRNITLVGGITTPLKNMSSLSGLLFPRYGENKTHVANHQGILTAKKHVLLVLSILLPYDTSNS